MNAFYPPGYLQKSLFYCILRGFYQDVTGKIDEEETCFGRNAPCDRFLGDGFFGAIQRYEARRADAFCDAAEHRGIFVAYTGDRVY